jgi:hypothetical protein
MGEIALMLPFRLSFAMTLLIYFPVFYCVWPSARLV